MSRRRAQLLAGVRYILASENREVLTLGKGKSKEQFLIIKTDRGDLIAPNHIYGRDGGFLKQEYGYMSFHILTSIDDVVRIMSNEFNKQSAGYRSILDKKLSIYSGIVRIMHYGYSQISDDDASEKIKSMKICGTHQEQFVSIKALIDRGAKDFFEAFFMHMNDLRDGELIYMIDPPM